MIDRQVFPTVRLEQVLASWTKGGLKLGEEGLLETGLVSASSVCVQLNSHSRLHMTRGCCGGRHFHLALKSMQQCFYQAQRRLPKATETQSSANADRQPAPVGLVCVCECLCVWVTLTVSFATRHSLSALERIHLHANVSCNRAPCPSGACR